MDAPVRAGRWLVSGALGLAVLGVSGCATTVQPDLTHAGPAVVVHAGADGAAAKPPATLAPGAKGAGAIRGNGAHDQANEPGTKVESDGKTKKVPAAKPRSINDSPDSPPSADTP